MAKMPMGFDEPNVVVLKESAANKSYATQLSEIESALSGLGDDLYRACIVTRTNQKFSYFGSGRLFSRTYIGSSGGTTYMFYEIFDVTNNTYTEYQGTSSTDKSSTTNTTKMQLLLT